MATREVTLPRRLWVGTYEYLLTLVEPRHAVLDGANGMTHNEEGGTAIFIAAHLGPRKTLEIVLHEVTHAINWTNDIDDGVEEETVATVHGAAWSALFLDNPKFQRWLTYTLNLIRKERKDA